MASEKHKAFVSQIESACAAMLQDRSPQGVSIGEICEFASTYQEQLAAVVRSLTKHGELELLKKLATAFSRFEGLNLPISLIRGISQLEKDGVQDEEIELPGIDSMPPTNIRRNVPEASEPQKTDVDDIAIAGQFARTLRMLPKQTQLRVINSVRAQNGLEE